MSVDKNAPVPDHVAIKADMERRQREAEEKRIKAQILRAEHALRLAEIGLEEEMVLRYTAGGIYPEIELRELAPEKEAKAREEITKYLTDLRAMTAKQPSGIIDPSGAPMSSEPVSPPANDQQG